MSHNSERARERARARARERERERERERDRQTDRQTADRQTVSESASRLASTFTGRFGSLYVHRWSVTIRKPVTFTASLKIGPVIFPINRSGVYIHNRALPDRECRQTMRRKQAGPKSVYKMHSALSPSCSHPLCYYCYYYYWSLVYIQRYSLLSSRLSEFHLLLLLLLLLLFLLLLLLLLFFFFFFFVFCAYFGVSITYRTLTWTT